MVSMGHREIGDCEVRTNRQGHEILLRDAAISTGPISRYSRESVPGLRQSKGATALSLGALHDISRGSTQISE